MSVAIPRRGKGAYQVDVQVAETLGGVGDVSRRRRRLGRHLTPLAALVVSAPGSNLGCQAGPHETAGNQPPRRPDARVHQAVHGVEDGKAKNLWDDGSEEEVSTKMGEPCSEISETRRDGDDLARWQSGQAG
jgi:hypothetical protein